MTKQDLFDEVDDIVNGVELTHNESISNIVGYIRSRPFDEEFEIEAFMEKFNKMVEGAHEVWWESFGDKWFNDLTDGVNADPKYSSATGVFEFEPFHETMDTFDWLMHMAKAEELLQNFIDMSSILSLELTRATDIIEDGWLIGFSGRNPRERAAEMRAHEMDQSDPTSLVWRGLSACNLHFEEYMRRLRVRLKALDRYQTLGKESIRYKAALLPKMDMEWGRVQGPDGGWLLVSNENTDPIGMNIEGDDECKCGCNDAEDDEDD